MNQLKLLRQRHKLTQAALADKLGTTQQTIQRWETNKTSIPSKALKELAIVFDCSVDELLGIAKYSRTRYSTWFLTESEKKGRRKLVGYYGGVYLTLQGVSKTRDYPIDDIAAKTIKNSFPFPENGSLGFSWMCLETMDNRIVFVNLKALKAAMVYTEDHKSAPAFEHPEVYRFLTEWNIDKLEDGITASEIAEQEGISQNLAQKAIGIIMHYEKTEQEDWSGLSFHSANIYWLDGEKTSHNLDRKLWWNLDDMRKIYNVPELYYSDTDEIPSGTMFIQEGDDENEYINFLNLDHIALIEVPAIKYWEIACEDSPDLLDIRDASPYMPHKNNNQEDSNTPLYIPISRGEIREQNHMRN